MESRGKLQALLAELEHRSSSVQRCSSDSSAGDESLSLRMRHVLHLLFQDYGTGGKGTSHDSIYCSDIDPCISN